MRDRPALFWQKVAVADGCWLWTAARHGSGYGCFWDGARLVQAHRYAYEQKVGPIPEGLTLDHLCMVKTCVNPAHLEPVTHRENNMRGNSMAARHARKTHCVKGHRFDEENTRINKQGGRVCRACHRLEVSASKRLRRAS